MGASWGVVSSLLRVGILGPRRILILLTYYITMNTKPDASQITYNTTTVQAHLDALEIGPTGSTVVTSVKDYGAIGDGVVDDTTAVQLATNATALLGTQLYFPTGVYNVGQITAVSNMNWIGESGINSIIKLKAGANPTENVGALLWSPSLNVDNVQIANLTFDGNSANNTTGDTLVLYGARPRLHNITVLNSASNAIKTDWAGPSFRPYGFEGRFTDITIDTPQKSGWLHRGPSDSHFDNVMIIDAGVSANNSYYGMYLDSLGTGASGRFNNLHHWNRSSVTNVAASGVYVGFVGNTFTNCHFEGGQLALNIAASGTTLSACHYYAPRGAYAVNIASAAAGTVISGCFGAASFSGNLNYTGLLLAGPGNLVDMTVLGAIKAIHFADSAAGGNNVTATGYITSGGAAYTGTAATNDTVSINILGPAGGRLAQTARSAFSAYQTTSQGLGAGVYTEVTLPNVQTDTLQEYNTSTSKFICKTAGFYVFQGAVSFTSAALTAKACAIYINGAIWSVLGYTAATSQCTLSGATPPIYLGVGGYADLRAYTDTADSTLTGAKQVYFGGYQIS